MPKSVKDFVSEVRIRRSGSLSKSLKLWLFDAAYREGGWVFDAWQSGMFSVEIKRDQTRDGYWIAMYESDKKFNGHVMIEEVNPVAAPAPVVMVPPVIAPKSKTLREIVADRQAKANFNL